MTHRQRAMRDEITDREQKADQKEKAALDNISDREQKADLEQKSDKD